MLEMHSANRLVLFLIVRMTFLEASLFAFGGDTMNLFAVCTNPVLAFHLMPKA